MICCFNIFTYLSCYTRARLKKSQYKNVTGAQIREKRIFHEPPISQTDLAQCVTKQGVPLDQGAISRIERRRRNISDYELRAIARCLGVTIDVLFAKRNKNSV